jgi:hypothetical protein
MGTLSNFGDVKMAFNPFKMKRGSMHVVKIYVCDYFLNGREKMMTHF